jgi:hypothetical protein
MITDFWSRALSLFYQFCVTQIEEKYRQLCLYRMLKGAEKILAKNSVHIDLDIDRVTK